MDFFFSFLSVGFRYFQHVHVQNISLTLAVILLLGTRPENMEKALT